MPQYIRRTTLVAALAATTLSAYAQDGAIAAGHSFARGACSACKRGGGRTAAPTEAHCDRTGFSQHRQHPQHDRDRSAPVPYDVTPENAEPHRHARADGGCDRLYPQLPLHTVILRARRPLRAAAVLWTGCAGCPALSSAHEWPRSPIIDDSDPVALGRGIDGEAIFDIDSDDFRRPWSVCGSGRRPAKRRDS